MVHFQNEKNKKIWLIHMTCLLCLALFSSELLAMKTLSTDSGMGSAADGITSSFGSLAKLITAGSYLAGPGFSIGAIMKFKQHKDNPTQIPIGTPIALVFIAAALLFLPSMLGITGSTMFGSSGGQTAGPGGTIYKSGG